MAQLGPLSLFRGPLRGSVGKSQQGQIIERPVSACVLERAQRENARAQMNAANNAHREETAYLARPGLLTEMLAHGVYAIGDLLHRTLEFVGRHPELLRPVA